MHGIDLGDLYRDRLSLRQVWVRIRALGPDEALARELHAATEKAEDDRRQTDVEDALAAFGRKG